MHLKAEKEKGRIFQHINKIECPFCNNSLDVFQFHRHMQIYHTKVSKYSFSDLIFAVNSTKLKHVHFTNRLA